MLDSSEYQHLAVRLVRVLTTGLEDRGRGCYQMTSRINALTVPFEMNLDKLDSDSVPNGLKLQSQTAHKALSLGTLFPVTNLNEAPIRAKTATGKLVKFLCRLQVVHKQSKTRLLNSHTGTLNTDTLPTCLFLSHGTALIRPNGTALSRGQPI